MDYTNARKIGDVAEAMVADAIAELQQLYGCSVFHDVLIAKQTRGGWRTAQLDHVIVDQYGVLVVETKARNGALMRGKYSEHKWTACYPGGKNKTMQNPLRQNEQHLHVLDDALEDAGWKLLQDQIRGMVVFVNTDISKLELDSTTAPRVADLAELRDRYATRYDFVSAVPMEPLAVAQLAATIGLLNRSNDPAIVAAHTRSMQRYKQDNGQPAKASKATTVSTPAHRTAAPVTPSTQSSTGLTRLAAGLILAAIALGVTWWAVSGLLDGTAPEWAWIVLILLTVMFGGEGDRRRRRSRSSSNPNRPPFLVRLVMALLVLGLGFAFIASLPKMAEQWAMSLGGLSEAATAQTPSAIPSGEPDVALALMRLQEADPELRAALINPDLPEVDKSPDGRVTYRWACYRKTASNAVEIRETSITLDRNGVIVGAGQ